MLENPCLMPDGHTLTIIYYVTRIPKNVSKAQLPRELLLILSLRLLRDYTSRVIECHNLIGNFNFNYLSELRGETMTTKMVLYIH